LADPKFAPILEARWLAELLFVGVLVEGIWNFHKLYQITCLHAHCFFLFFSFLWVFPSGLVNTANNVRDKRTPCFLIIEVVVSKHLSLSHLRHHLGQWGCYGWININRYYDIEFHSWFNKISSLHLRLLWSNNIIRHYDIELHS
jgi:hypothetical protein